MMRCPSIDELPPPPKEKSGWPWTSESYHWWLDADSHEWPLLTLVAPSYNTASYLEATIRSVLLQGYPQLHFIIIDGGSRDGSVDIIEKYAPWIKYWISEKDNGQYDAILKGFALDCGDVMGWLNSDDMLVPNGMGTVGSIFSQYRGKVHWLTGKAFYWNQQGNHFQLLSNLPLTQKLIKWGGHDGRALQWIMQEGTFWTRALWEQAGAALRTDLQYAGDFDLWRRFASHEKLYLVESMIGGNRRRVDQKTADSGRYNQEVKAILDQDPYCRRINRILGTQPLRSLIRIYLRFFLRDHRIQFNPDASKWVIR